MLFAVLNESRGVRLAHAVERAESALARLRGLLGRDGLRDGAGLHIVPCNGIHTFLMRFPIDAAFLDAAGVVVHLIHAMPPWRMSRIHFGADSVLELPAGTLVRTGTKPGDRLRFDPADTTPR